VSVAVVQLPFTLELAIVGQPVEPPIRVHVVALVEVQANVVDSPLWMLVGVAVICTVGVGVKGAADTVTATVAFAGVLLGGTEQAIS
jgi:hypothetical protein